MFSRLLQYKKPQFKNTMQEPISQTYPGTWRFHAREQSGNRMVFAAAGTQYALTLLGTGDSLGQA